jgi:hypothetical protein
MPTAIPEIVKVTTTFVPALKNIRLVRGMIIPLGASGTMNEAQALAEYQRSKDRNRATRTRLKQQHNKRVIKVSDAMECLEKELDGKLAILFGQALLNVILGGTNDCFDLAFGRIAGCMIGKALQQGNQRTLGKFVRKRVGEPEFSEIVKIRRGKLHPHA